MAYDLTQPFVFEPMKSGGGGFNPMTAGGLLFGGGGSALDEYLTEDQKRQMQQQAMLQAAAALLQAGGRSATPISLGQALGSALQAGTAGYQGAQQNAIQQLLTKQKIDEAKRAQAAQEAYQKFIMGQPSEGQTITPEQAISAPGMAVGPTVERAALIGQTMPSVTPTGGAALTQQQRALLASLPAEKGIPEALKLMQPQEVTGQPFRASDGKFYIQTKTGGVIPAPVIPETKPTGQPQEVMIGGQPALVQYYEDGSYKVVSGLSPKAEASPAEVKLLQAAKMPITMENIMAIRRSAANQTTNILNAEKKGTELAYENAMKNLNESRAMAQSANATLSNIDRILPALDTAIVGPISDTRTTLLRIGKQLNIAGENADQILRNTATVVQGLAQQELDAASQMRGQGALTEGERAILRRAAGGDQSLTAGELQQGLMAAQRSARARLASHQDLLNKATTAIPELGKIAPLYEVQTYGAQTLNPLQNAIQQEIDRRKAAGGRR
jgi:hypothetical protein